MRIFLVVVSLCALCSLVLALAPRGAKAAEVAGRFAIVNGEVRVGPGATETDAKAAVGKTARPNDPVHDNEVIKTGKNSSAKVLFTDQSVMDLGSETALRVSDYAIKDGENRTATFSLMFGKLRALVTKAVGAKGNVQVRSGDAVMGVRGTEFMVVGTVGGVPAIVVISGSLRVIPLTGGPPITVGPGQMIVASPQTFSQSVGGGGGIVQVSGEMMGVMMGEIKVADTTFMGALVLAPPGEGGEHGPMGPNMAMGIVGDLVSGYVGVPPPASESGIPLPPLMMEGLILTNFLPPVTTIPGNLVHLTVDVQ